MENCKSIATLININSKKMKFGLKPINTKERRHKKISFKKDIGCLMYAMACTRLNISFVVGQVNKFRSVFPTCDIMIGQMSKAYLNI
jgi:hypothetical protein